MIIPFLPASGIVKLGFVIAERILYIPSIGYCMLIAIGFDVLCKNLTKFKKVQNIFLNLTTYFEIILIIQFSDIIYVFMDYGFSIVFKMSSSCL